MFETRITIDPSPKKLAKIIGDSAKDWGDYKPVWQKLLPTVRAEMGDTIQSAGNGRWVPLSKSSIDRKVRAGHRNPGQPLIGTGRLLADVRSKGKASITKTRMRYAPSGKDSYPFVQHFGSKKRGIPARRYISVTPDMRKAAEALLDAHARTLLNRLASKLRGA